MDNQLLRATYFVGDINAAIAFYRDALGCRLVQDNVLAVDHRFPPAAPDGAPGPDKHRGKLGEGEPILVVKSRDPDEVYRKVLATGAVIVSPPANWTVPGYEPGTVIRLRSMSRFDPNGLYIEFNVVLPAEKTP